jgi:hypothetical protein
MASEVMYVYDVGRGEEGPVPESTIRGMLTDGRLAPDCYVKSDHMLHWVPVRSHPAFQPGAAPTVRTLPMPMPSMRPPAKKVVDEAVISVTRDHRKASYTQTYVATAAAGMWKMVSCVNCGCEWAYYLVSEGSDTGTGLKFIDEAGAVAKAKDSAAANARKYVQGRCGVVPCPRCGRLQDDMIAQIGSDSIADTFSLALGAIVAGVIVFMVLANVMSALRVREDVGLVVCLAGSVALGSIVWLKRVRGNPDRAMNTRESLDAQASAMERGAYDQRRGRDDSLPELHWPSGPMGHR